jgi:non-ribosomal peptide synthetase component F
VCRDLSQAYAARAEGRDPDLAVPALDTRDHAVWQRRSLDGARLERLTEHWRQHLAGAPPLIALPLDRPRPPVQGFAGARHPIDLDDDLLRGVVAAARSLGVTPYMYLLAVFGLLLYRWSGQTDVVVGTPAANRSRVELEGLVGLLTNTIVMRIGLDGNPTFAELVARVRAVALANYDHDELPFERIVDAVRPPRDPSHHPLFQVNFRVAPPSAPQLVLPGLVVQPVPIDIGYSKFDLALELQLRTDRIGGYIEYNEALFEPTTTAVVAGGLEVLLRAVVADPHRPIATLPAVAPVAAPRRVGPGRERRSSEVTR